MNDPPSPATIRAWELDVPVGGTSYNFSEMVQKVSVKRKEITSASEIAKKDEDNQYDQGKNENDAAQFNFYDEEAPKTVSWIPNDMPVTKENLLNALQVDEKRREEIWNIEQRLDQWKVERAGRITGSRVGSACGLNKYETHAKLINSWLYNPISDNPAMKYGRDNEDTARDTYKAIRINQHNSVPLGQPKPIIPFDATPQYVPTEYRDITDIPLHDPNIDIPLDQPYDMRIEVRGLIVHPSLGFCAYSPDGECYEGSADCVDGNSNDGAEGNNRKRKKAKFLLELKCPQRGVYKEIPPYYYAQIQFGMWLLDLPFCDFSAWTTTEVSVQRFPYNKKYFENFMWPRIYDFYMNKFIPEAIIAIEKLRKWHDENNKQTKRVKVICL